MKSQAPPRSAPTTSSFSPCPVMISVGVSGRRVRISANRARPSIPGILMSVTTASRSEEHTSELQSQSNLVCRLLLEKKNKLEQRGIALKTLDEDTFGLNASLLGRYGFDLLILFTKPCHMKIAEGTIILESSQ